MNVRVGARLLPGIGLLALLIAIPYLSVGTGGVFSGRLDSPGTLQLLALMLVVRRRGDELRPPLRVHGAALVRARPVLRRRRLRGRDRHDQMGMGVLAGRGPGRGHRSRPSPRARDDQPPRQRDRVCDGDAGLRGGRRDPRQGQSDSWTGADEGVSVAYEKLRARSSASSTPSTCTGSRSASPSSSSYLHVVGRLVSRARLAGDP